MAAAEGDIAGLIDIELIGDFREVNRMIDYLMSRLTYAELSLFLEEEMAPYLQKRVRDRFASEGDDVSGGWAPLKPATERIRAWGRERQLWTVGDAHPINRRTDEMYDYLTQGLWPIIPIGSDRGVALSSPRDKTNKPAMRKRLSQAQRGGPTSPPRPVLGLGERDLMHFLAAFALHLGGF